MKYFSLFLLLLTFQGCQIIPESSSSSTQNPPEAINYYVEVFTLAPVVNALVSDANNQVAHYDATQHKYYFTQPIAFPIQAQALSTSYVDVDYDNNETASDIRVSSYFQSHPMRSFCSEITPLSSIYYDTQLAESNISTQSYLSDVQQRFGVNLCQDIQTDQTHAQVVFGAYNHTLETNSTFSLDAIESSATKVSDFFNSYLNIFNDTTKKVRYYSAYDALLQLDAARVMRVDTIHKPNISSLLRPPLSMTKNSSGVDVFDILPYNNTDVYLAAGHDVLSKVDTNLQNQVFDTNVTLLSFGSRLYKQNFQGKDCLFLANSKIGVSTYAIDSLGFHKKTDMLNYIDSAGRLVPFSDTAITNTNGYISVNENKRLLGIATQEKGYFLLNMKNRFNGCDINTTIYNGQTINDIQESRDFIISASGGYAVDATFRDDGTYLYVAKKDKGIDGYKTDILDVTEVNGSKKIFSLYNDAQAYNLQLFNNDNELFVTTNQGLQIYDVGSALASLSYVSSYKTEGAQTDYFQAIDSYEDFVFLTDGYKGIKVLKLSNSFEPMLCGVAYFAPANNPYELAKTTSVAYNNTQLYVGIASYGIVKFQLDDILFQHCK